MDLAQLFCVMTVVALSQWLTIRNAVPASVIWIPWTLASTSTGYAVYAVLPRHLDTLAIIGGVFCFILCSGVPIAFWFGGKGKATDHETVQEQLE